jgi:hypothetical protein
MPVESSGRHHKNEQRVTIATPIIGHGHGEYRGYFKSWSAQVCSIPGIS